LAILAGLFLISAVAEGVEFLLVAALHGSVTSDQEVYFAIRNRPSVLAAKFLYNGLAALLGGYAAAWIAGRARVLHGAALALLQLSGLLYGMTASPYAPTTPLWMWVGLCVTMPPLVLLGAWLRDRPRTSEV
jgi:hypothetical protein